MNFPVFSQLSRELDLETSSLETASSSRESTNLRSLGVSVSAARRSA